MRRIPLGFCANATRALKWGLKAIDRGYDYAESEELKRSLDQCRDKHERLKKEIRELLDKYQDEGKEPGAVAKEHVLDENGG